ncbi:MAG: type II toxin-antitoxin system RelE/ParE family toxin [Deltaproteobacteria bacterium]|nr:MAG: type II toxin-antitoxin system RelE/ParE family toxin [Deltaproteobacteria bacterium]
MKKYPIIYLPAAEKDIESIFDYIRRDSPARASKFIQIMDRKISRLENFPLSGAQSRDPYVRGKNFRIVVVGEYLVFYRFEKKQLFIHRILHSRRRFGFLFRS